MKNFVISHYDKLIENENDPFHDPEPLKEYMDKWDGDIFIEKLSLDKNKSVLEIGVGTGRLADRTAPLCKRLCGIDISPKTAERALLNLKSHDNIDIICSDFMAYEFTEKFDVIYSSLTFMHIEDKQSAINKAASLLGINGRFVLSIDKNQDSFIDATFSRIEIYPDNPDNLIPCIANSGLELKEHLQTEFAHIFVAEKR